MRQLKKLEKVNKKIPLWKLPIATFFSPKVIALPV